MEPLIITSQSALEAVVSDALKRSLSQFLPVLVQRATAEPYLTKKKLGELTGWSNRQIEYKKANGELPFIRRGRTILFPTDAVYAFLEKGRVPASK